MKPRRELFERIFPRQIDSTRWRNYPRVREILRSAPIPEDILATEYYRSSRVSVEQARTAGFPTRPVDLAVDWDIVRDEIDGSRVPSAIAGQSFYGLNSGAKNSLDRNYLAMAEATGHVEILPLHSVVAIEQGVGGRYAVTVVSLDDDGVMSPPRRLLCKHLFLAAGSVGTTSLLVRAKATRAIPALNEHVGRHWAANGDMPVTRCALPFTNAGTGGPGGHFLMEDLENPFGPTSLVELVLPPHIHAALGASGPPPHFANYASLGIPPAIGSFTYDAGADTVTLNWPGTDSRLENFLNAAQQTLVSLDQRNGSLTLGLSEQPTGPLCGGRRTDRRLHRTRQPLVYDRRSRRALHGSHLGAQSLIRDTRAVAATSTRPRSQSQRKTAWGSSFVARRAGT